MAPTKKTLDEPVVEPAPEGAADAPAGRDPDFAPDEPEALEAVDEPERAAEPLPFISAGVASDLEMQGWAGDPTTGGIFRKDAETGEITYTPRT